MTSSSLPHVRRTAHQREERRIRIMAKVRAGFSYEAIARDEQLSYERVRQIVVKSLQHGKDETRVDHVRVQVARLEPALRLAARGVENGKLSAISQLLQVLDRLDKYDGVAEAANPPYNENVREKLLAKLDRAAERLHLGAPFEPAAAPSDDAGGEVVEGRNLDGADFGFGDLATP